MKYLVMECHPAYAVVLCDNGSFLKVANMRYEVGQTVTEVTEVTLPTASEKTSGAKNRRWISGLAAMAACLILVMSSFFTTGRAPYASVYLTINPEVRIDVDKNDQVMDIEGMNEDGKALLENYDFHRKDLDLVMDDLVDRAIDMGYLHEGGTVTLSLDADDEWVITHKDHLSTHLNDHLTQKITVVIDMEQIIHDQNNPEATSVITIPISSDSYGDSDYGETEAHGSSDYDVPDMDDSPYEATDEDGQTDYGDTNATEGHTDYEQDVPEGTSDYEDHSPYHATSDYASVSDYDVPETSTSNDSEYDFDEEESPEENVSDYEPDEDERDEDDDDEDDDDDEEDDDDDEEDDEDDDDDDDDEDDEEDD